MGGRKPSPAFIASRLDADLVKRIKENAERLGPKNYVPVEAQFRKLRAAVIQYIRAKEKKRGAPPEDQAYVALCAVVGRIAGRPKNANRNR